MQRRVLIILLGMVIASLASACGQKGPLFLPEGTDDNVTAYAAHYANDGPGCEQVGVTHTGSSSTASPSTRTIVSARMLRPALATTHSMKVSS
jgi:predicted small lipoprotein YifL